MHNFVKKKKKLIENNKKVRLLMRCNKKKTDTNLGSRPMEIYEFFPTIPKNSLIFKHIFHDFPVFSQNLSFQIRA